MSTPAREKAAAYRQGFREGLTEGNTRPEVIDRDALVGLLADALGQHRLDGSVAVGVIADRVLALLRPVDDGVTLTREEAVLVREWFAALRSRQWETEADLAIAARLEAAS